MCRPHDTAQRTEDELSCVYIHKNIGCTSAPIFPQLNLGCYITTIFCFVPFSPLLLFLSFPKKLQPIECSKQQKQGQRILMAFFLPEMHLFCTEAKRDFSGNWQPNAGNKNLLSIGFLLKPSKLKCENCFYSWARGQLGLGGGTWGVGCHWITACQTNFHIFAIFMVPIKIPKSWHRKWNIFTHIKDCQFLKMSLFSKNVCTKKVHLRILSRP